MKIFTWMLVTAVIAIPLAMFVGCGDGNGPGGTDGDTDSDIDTDHEWVLGEPCPLDQRVGLFEIGHFDLSFAYSALTGVVKDGVVPGEELFPREEVGDCKLMQKINPTCDPPCLADETCDHGVDCVPGDCPGECIPFPSNQNAGTLTITGLLTPASIEPNVVNYYEVQTEDSPPFAPGEQITLYAGGGDLEPFALDGLGVTVLAMPSDQWTIERDETTLDVISDLEITWTPADNGEGAHILATLNIDQHGNSPATMFCKWEDTGSGTIPMSLLNTFTSYGVTGYAAGFLYRRTVDSENISLGCVEMRALSVTKAELVVTNHDPMIGP